MPSKANGPQVGTSFRGVQGTFWTGSAWVQNCVFQDWPQPSGLPAVAVAKNLYSGAGFCGVCVEVSQAGGTGEKHRGIINSQCTDCPDNALDMSPDLWEAVMPTGTDGQRPGKGTFDWAVVPCGFEEPIKLINKDHTSLYWFAMQAAGHNTPVKSLQVRGEVQGQQANNQKWLGTKREEYNYFTLNDGQSLGQSPTAEVMITCTNGKVVHATGIPLNGRHTATSQGNC